MSWCSYLLIFFLHALGLKASTPSLSSLYDNELVQNTCPEMLPLQRL
jgi:hypothetical protein